MKSLSPVSLRTCFASLVVVPSVLALWLSVAGPANAQQRPEPPRIPPDAKGFQQFQIMQEYLRQQSYSHGAPKAKQTDRQTFSQSTTTPSRRIQVRIDTSSVAQSPARATVPVRQPAQVLARDAGGSVREVNHSGPVVSTIAPTPCGGR